MHDVCLVVSEKSLYQYMQANLLMQSESVFCITFVDSCDQNTLAACCPRD